MWVCGYGQLYKITSNKGKEAFTVNGEHLLCLRHNKENSYKKRGIKSNYKFYMTVEEYLVQHNAFKRANHLYRANMIEFPEKRVKIEPYFLGLWLGDGDKKSVRITTQDQEVVNYLQEYSDRLGHKLKWQNQKTNALVIQSQMGDDVKGTNLIRYSFY